MLSPVPPQPVRRSNGSRLSVSIISREDGDTEVKGPIHRVESVIARICGLHVMITIG
jgi:hypothetical protein